MKYDLDSVRYDTYVFNHTSLAQIKLRKDKAESYILGKRLIKNPAHKISLSIGPTISLLHLNSKCYLYMYLSGYAHL